MNFEFKSSCQKTKLDARLSFDVGCILPRQVPMFISLDPFCKTDT